MVSELNIDKIEKIEDIKQNSDIETLFLLNMEGQNIDIEAKDSDLLTERIYLSLMKKFVFDKKENK